MGARKRLSFLPEDDNYYSSKKINNPQKKKIQIQSVKYRTEQNNITKIEDDVKSYSLLKKEYNLDLDLKENKASVTLSDLYYDFKPPTLSKVYEFVAETEKIRNNIKFKFNGDGRLCNITNKEEVFKNWDSLKNNGLEEIEFIQVLKKNNKEEYINILHIGDKQFDPAAEGLEKDYSRDLFYVVLFDKHLTHDLKSISSEEEVFQSQLFPNVKMPITIRYDLLNETENTFEIRKVAEAIINESLIKEIETEYNIIHKPLIHYSFSNYKLTYRVRYEVDKTTRIIENAEMTIIENVEHNIQNICKYKLKKL